MADELKAGDRVMIRNGELGTVLRVEGGRDYIQLDSGVCKPAWVASLKKIEDEKT